MTRSGKKLHLQENMYPRVKVRVQREEADQYAYEKTSLQSLKSFEWLSLNHPSSLDDSQKPVVRLPRSYVPLSPPPSFYHSKEEINKKNADAKENQKSARATSVPRPRAVLSSPDNDGIIGSRTRARMRPSSPGHKNGDAIKNRHSQCKIFLKSSAAEGLTPKKAREKESWEVQTRSRAAAEVKKMGPSWAQR